MTLEKIDTQINEIKFEVQKHNLIYMINLLGKSKNIG